MHVSLMKRIPLMYWYTRPMFVRASLKAVFNCYLVIFGLFTETVLI